jgi:hypothetical protein
VFHNQYFTMKKLSLIFIYFYAVCSLFAQKEATFKMQISSDTVGLEGTLEVQFILENAKMKKWMPPSFEGFEVQGPSTSNMMSMVNGDVTQKTIYTYYLIPRETGTYKIGKATANTEGGDMTTEETNVVVLKDYVAPKKPRNRSFFDDDDDDLFFRRQPSRPQQPKQPEVPAKKKKYETERI